MKPYRMFVTISILSLAFGASTFGYSQKPEDKHQDKHQDKQQGKGQPLGDNGRHLGQQKQMQRTLDEERDQKTAQRRAWQERRANHWEYEHRTWTQRGGYRGTRIPDEYFVSHFGHEHPFRIYSLPFVYEGGNPRFQYEGYWFTMVDPYPEHWGGTWYEADDVYVEYSGDGYYLFNPKHPSQHGVAIEITL